MASRRITPIRITFFLVLSCTCCSTTAVSFLQAILLLCIAITAVVVYALKFGSKTGHSRPKIFYKDNPLANHILEKCKFVKEPYSPPTWATNCHIQTLLPKFVPWVFHRSHGVQYDREVIILTDNGTIALDWATITSSSSVNRSSPVMIIVPGLCSESDTMATLCTYGVNHGFRPVVLIKRGHRGLPLTSPKLTCVTDTSDLHDAITFIHEKYPCAKLTAVGFSAGTALIVKYAGEHGTASYLNAWVSICSGYNLESTWKAVTLPYSFGLLKSQKAIVSKHASTLDSVIDVQAVMRCSDNMQFEEAVYCKLYGHGTMAAYYNHSTPDWDTIATPFLCINAEDDPICVKENIPYERFESHPYGMLVTTERGGHCSFIESFSSENWAHKVAIEYILTVLDFQGPEEGK